jgi:carbamoyltransferase
MSINVIGISALYHNSACCLIQDGVLITAVEEERFSRRKNDSSMPGSAFEYCLQSNGLSITDIDCIAYYEDPVQKLERQIWSGFDVEDPQLSYVMDPKRPVSEIRHLLGYDGPVRIVNHHLAHAASSYFFSGFEEAAILTVDGVGEWATTTYGYGRGNEIDIFEEVEFPHSIGLFYAAITSYLGFKVNSGEYKVMGLAPYGKAVYVEELRKLITLLGNGQYELDMTYFEFVNGNRMYSDKLIGLLKQPPRIPESEITQFHKDVARSLQYVLEEIMLEKVHYLHAKTHSSNLCMAGGVALNCVANRRILEDGPFTNVFVQPASSDSGCAVGAAAIVYTQLTGNRVEKLKHVYLGPEYSSREIKGLLENTALRYEDYEGKPEELIKRTAELIADGKVTGWFQGRMEFGPRALGSRSILADPRSAEMRSLINSMVKKREDFRPFAPVVLQSKYTEHFDLKTPSPYMLFTCKVVSQIDLPAITHVDQSARVQTVDGQTNPLLVQLLEEFDRVTGCPIILNTSFNVRGEPIVMTPEDALKCFINTKIDCLVLGEFIIIRSVNKLTGLRLFLKSFEESQKQAGEGRDNYTFI